MTIRPEFKLIADKMGELCDANSYFAPLEIQYLAEHNTFFENPKSKSYFLQILTRLWIEQTIDQDTSKNANALLHQGIPFLQKYFSTEEITYLADKLSELAYLIEILEDD